MIVRCPTCQAEIIHNGIIKSHATYKECLEALATELFLIVKRIIRITVLVIQKTERLEKEIHEITSEKNE